MIDGGENIINIQTAISLYQQSVLLSVISFNPATTLSLSPYEKGAEKHHHFFYYFIFFSPFSVSEPAPPTESGGIMFSFPQEVSLSDITRSKSGWQRLFPLLTKVDLHLLYKREREMSELQDQSLCIALLYKEVRSCVILQGQIVAQFQKENS